MVRGDAMDASRWERVKELFDLALQKESAQREAFLNQACSGDDALRQEVASLLAASEESDGLSRAPEMIQAASEPAVQEAIVGRRIGSYQVQHRIGKGGMASVYLAVRADDQYKKGVALKLIPPGLVNDDLLRRFRNERQTLAALDHPNIVKMLDGGTTDDGLPYLVMDYIEGTPIDQYCDGHKLSTEERLRLFLGVCAAVSYAHQRLVIHRDLKPGNILVTADGTPKLLDFGIAKLLNPEAVATLVLTQTGQRPMTLQYASPEQVRGEPLTNATDIYSLGVVLYELLTGHRPHHVKSYTRLGIEQAICEDEPAKPSTVVAKIEEQTHADGSTTSITPEQVSRTREGDPKKLRSRLQGDLDAIVMTALRKEPQRRYTSAYDFSEDIRRHLEQLPVKARSSTAMYRGAKFIRRHKEMAATALIFILLLAAGVSWYLMSGRRPRVSEPAVATVKVRRSIAVLGFKNLSGKPDEAWLSTALSEMLTTELAAGEKLRTIPGENVARMKVDLAVPESDSLAPDTLQKIYRNLGSNLVVLGSYLSMGGQLRLDLRLQDATNGEILAAISETGRESEVSDLVSRTGTVMREKLGLETASSAEEAAVRASLPSNPEAVRLYSEGLARLRLFDNLGARDLLQKAVERDPNHALAHSALAAAWSALGYDQKAREEAQRAFELSASLPLEERSSIEGRYRELTNEWDKAVEIYRTLFGFFPDDLDYGLRLAIAQTSAAKGKDAVATLTLLRKLPPPAGTDSRIDLALAFAAESVADFKQSQSAAAQAALKAQAQGARMLLAKARLGECWAFRGLGELNRAIPLCEEARQIYTSAGDRYGVGAALLRIGILHSDTGDRVQAMKDYEESLAIFRAIGSEGSVEPVLGSIALALEQQGDVEGAMKKYFEALATARRTNNKRNIGIYLMNIGSILEEEGDLAAALKMHNESLAIARETGTKTAIAHALINAGDVLFNMGDLEGAKNRLEQTVSLTQEIGDKRGSGYALQSLGDVALAGGDLVTARKYYAEALEVRKSMRAALLGAETSVAIATVDIEEGHPSDAEASVRTARDIFRKESQIGDEIAADAVLADALVAEGKPALAQAEIDGGNQLLSRSSNRISRLQFSISAGRVQFASARLADAKRVFEGVLAEASKYGLIGYQFEARLTLAEIEMKSGTALLGRSRLQVIEKEASTKGFGLIAKKAAAARR
jgi:serine/threonine protein kinase/tetratricopeptide (TPR) repeat protein